MITGMISNVKASDFAYSKNLQDAFAYLQKEGIEGLLNLPVGKVIVSEGVKVNRNSYVAKEFAIARTEGHKEWCDIQLVLKGKEDFGYADLSKNLPTTTEYDPVKDVVFYDGELDGIIHLRPGMFALVFPEDLHKPCIKVNDEQVEKIVVKVKIDW